MSELHLDEIHARLQSRPVLVSVSGGKDSTVLAHWMLHVVRPAGGVHLVHADTGWEHADTDRYVRDVLPDALGQEIHIVRSIPDLDPQDEAVAERVEALLGRTEPSAYVRWILRKGMFSSRVKRWCTSHLKVYPLQDYMREQLDGRCINAVGVRAAESRARSKLGEWDMDGGPRGLVYPVWRPLIRWSEAEVIGYHHDHSLPVNPLYTRGASRVGCFPCIASRKHEIAYVARTDPGRIEALRVLEEHVTRRALERREAAGKPLTFPDGTPRFRSFFQNPQYRKHQREAKARGEDPADRAHQQARIDDVIEWAMGDGPDVELASWEAGCVRWGVCELPMEPAQRRLFAQSATASKGRSGGDDG